jgi:hypothetical protein
MANIVLALGKGVEENLGEKKKPNPICVQKGKGSRKYHVIPQTPLQGNNKLSGEQTSIRSLK